MKKTIFILCLLMSCSRVEYSDYELMKLSKNNYFSTQISVIYDEEYSLCSRYYFYDTNSSEFLRNIASNSYKNKNDIKDFIIYFEIYKVDDEIIFSFEKNISKYEISTYSEFYFEKELEHMYLKKGIYNVKIKILNIDEKYYMSDIKLHLVTRYQGK